MKKEGGTLSEPIDRLELEISASSGQAEQGLDGLINALSRLKSGSRGANDEVAALSSGLRSFVEQTAKLKSIGESFKVLSNDGKALSNLKNIKLPTKFAEQLEQIKKAVQGYQTVHEGLESISTSLERIGKLGDVKISGTIAKRITEISNAVKGVDDAAIQKLDSMTASLERLAGVDVKGLPSAIRALNSAKKIAKPDSVAPLSTQQLLRAGDTGNYSVGIRDDGDVSDRADKIKETGNAAADASKKIKEYKYTLRDLGKAASDAVDKGINKLTSGIKKFAKSAVKDFVSPVTRSIAAFNKWKSAIGRVAFYRAVRTAIKMVTDGLKEGVNNLYYYSQLAGTAFAPAMDRLATSALYLKNSFGAMASPLIEALAPAIDFIIDKFVELLNVVNMVFAAITGKSTYTKALKKSVQYGDDLEKSMGGAADAAKEFKRYLIGIDELTIIPDQADKGSGGGGGGGLADEYGTMFEEAELPQRFTDWAKEIRDAIDSGDWYGAGEILAEKLNGLMDSVNYEQWGNKLGETIQKGISFGLGFIRKFNWQGAGENVADFFNGLFDSIVPEDVGALLASKIRVAVDFAYGFVTKFQWDDLGDWLGGVVNGWFDEIDWKKTGETIGKTIIGVLDTAINFLETTDWKNIGESIANLMNGVDWNELLGKGLQAFGNAVGALADTVSSFLGNLDGMSSAVVSIGTGLSSWRLSTSMMNWFDKVSSGSLNSRLSEMNTSIAKISAGLAVSVTGLTIEWGGMFDVGYNGPKFENIMQSAIGAALGIAGATVAFGSAGLAIGILASIVLGISAFKMGYDKKAVEEELKARLGEVEITVEQAKKMAESRMSGPLYTQLDVYITAKNNVQSAFDDFVRANRDLDSLVYKASIGIIPSEVTISDATDTYINSALAAYSARGEEFTLAINLGLKPGDVQSELSGFISEYFSQGQQKLTELGERLREKVNIAFADGILSEKEYETIYNLQKEMNEITQKVADAEYKAKISMTVEEADIDVENLSSESIMKLQDELLKIAQDRIDQNKEASLTLRAGIELAYEEGALNEQEYLRAIKEANRNFELQNASIIADAFAPIGEALADGWSDSLQEAQKLMSADSKDFMSSILQESMNYDSSTGYLVKEQIGYFTEDVSNNLRNSFVQITGKAGPQAAKAISEVIEKLSPSTTQLENQAKVFREAGEKLPKSLSEGLHDVNTMKALTGDMDAINYLIGEKLSTDKTFIESLSKAEDAGKILTSKIGEGLLSNAELVKNLDGTISLVTDTITKNFGKLSPEIEKALSEAGISIGTLHTDVEVNAKEGTVTKDARDILNMATLGKVATTVFADLKKGWSGTAEHQLDLESLTANISDYTTNGMQTPVIESVSDLQQYWNNLGFPEIQSIAELKSYLNELGAPEIQTIAEFSTYLNELGIPGISTVAEFDKYLNRLGIPAMSTIAEFNTWANKLGLPEISSEADLVSFEYSMLPYVSVIAQMAKLDQRYTPTIDVIGNVVGTTQSGGGGGKNTTAAFNAAGGIFYGGRWHPIEGYAGGGAVKSARLFYANENGIPELVGRIGGNTAVMNNGQIVSSVASGVYQAVSAAFGQLGNYFGTIASGMSRIPEAISSLSLEDDRKYMFFPSHDDMNLSAARTPQNRDAGNEGAFAGGMRSANEDVISVIFAAATRIVTAIQENGGDVYMDSDKVGQKTTQVQNRNSRIFGHSVQVG